MYMNVHKCIKLILESHEGLLLRMETSGPVRDAPFRKTAITTSKSVLQQCGWVYGLQEGGHPSPRSESGADYAAKWSQGGFKEREEKRSGFGIAIAMGGYVRGGPLMRNLVHTHSSRPLLFHP